MKFETTADLLEDGNFQNFVREHISGIIKKQVDRPEPKAGMKYKRNWYDRFTDLHPLTYEFFMKNIDKVLLKESNLNREAREVLTMIYQDNLFRTLAHYQKLTPSI